MTTQTDRNVLIQVRLPESLVKQIDHLSVDWGVYRADAMRRLLNEALELHRNQGRLWQSEQSEPSQR